MRADSISGYEAPLRRLKSKEGPSDSRSSLPQASARLRPFLSILDVQGIRGVLGVGTREGGPSAWLRSPFSESEVSQQL